MTFSHTGAETRRELLVAEFLCSWDLAQLFGRSKELDRYFGSIPCIINLVDYIPAFVKSLISTHHIEELASLPNLDPELILFYASISHHLSITTSHTSQSSILPTNSFPKFDLEEKLRCIEGYLVGIRGWKKVWGSEAWIQECLQLLNLEKKRLEDEVRNKGRMISTISRSSDWMNMNISKPQTSTDRDQILPVTTRLSDMIIYSSLSQPLTFTPPWDQSISSAVTETIDWNLDELAMLQVSLLGQNGDRSFGQDHQSSFTI